jgi:opine dehydrogenase
MNRRYRIAVVGAGNGGQAIAGYLALKGHSVALYNRSPSRIRALAGKGGVTLTGMIEGFGSIDLITTDIGEALDGAGVIMVVTTADGHPDIARSCAPHLRDGQIIILNPGRTGGALEFRRVLAEEGSVGRTVIGETQTLMFACRSPEPGLVHVLGVKKTVPLSALPAGDIDLVLSSGRNLFECFVPAHNVLETSFQNIGAMIHPPLVLLNSAHIERNVPFLLYREGMTPRGGQIIERLDMERISVARAYCVDTITISEWFREAYGVSGGQSVYSCVQLNPAYDKIAAPCKLATRLLTEDIPTGLVPLACLAELASIRVPLMRSIVEIGSALLGRDLWSEGRNLDRLGLKGKNIQEIIEFVGGTVSEG